MPTAAEAECRVIIVLDELNVYWRWSLFADRVISTVLSPETHCTPGSQGEWVTLALRFCSRTDQGGEGPGGSQLTQVLVHVEKRP